MNAPTRVCTTCLCSSTQRCTEIIEPTGKIEPQEVSSLLDQALSYLKDVKAIAICGTFPSGVDESFYQKIVDKKEKDCCVFVDAYKGVKNLLKGGNVMRY